MNLGPSTEARGRAASHTLLPLGLSMTPQHEPAIIKSSHLVLVAVALPPPHDGHRQLGVVHAVVSHRAEAHQGQEVGLGRARASRAQHNPGSLLLLGPGRFSFDAGIAKELLDSDADQEDSVGSVAQPSALIAIPVESRRG